MPSAAIFGKLPFLGDCDLCPDGMPRFFQFTLAGITNGTCASCTALNGTWVLPYSGDCVWAAPTEGACSSNTVAMTWQLQYYFSTGGNIWRLFWYDARVQPPTSPWGLASYTTTDPWNCWGPRTGR